jgi:hypothetical protein
MFICQNFRQECGSEKFQIEGECVSCSKCGRHHDCNLSVQKKVNGENMKPSKINNRYITAVAIISLASLTSSCGSSSGSSVASGIVSSGTVATSTCTILSQVMSFSGTAAEIDSANLYAGSQYGSTLLLGSGGASSGYEFINTVMPPADNYATRTTSYLSYLGINVTSSSTYSTTGYTYGTAQPTIQGSFTFSASAWAEILSTFGSTYTGTTYTTGVTTLSSVTACNLSINSGLYPWNTSAGQGTLYGGYIYMTINGSAAEFPI